MSSSIDTCNDMIGILTLKSYHSFVKRKVAMRKYDNIYNSIQLKFGKINSTRLIRHSRVALHLLHLGLRKS